MTFPLSEDLRQKGTLAALDGFGFDIDQSEGLRGTDYVDATTT